MIKSQTDGPVKTELSKVLLNANRHVKELWQGIKEGEALVQTKETALTQLQKKLDHFVDLPHKFVEYKRPEPVVPKP